MTLKPRDMPWWYVSLWVGTILILILSALFLSGCAGRGKSVSVPSPPMPPSVTRMTSQVMPQVVQGPKYYRVTFDVYPGLYDGTNGQCVIWGTQDFKTWVQVGVIPMIGTIIHCTNYVTNLYRDYRTSFLYQ